MDPPRYLTELCPVDLLPNVLNVLDLLVMSIPSSSKSKKFKPIPDAYSFYRANKDRYLYDTKKVKVIGKKCVDLLNKSLCSHRYEEAVKLLWIVCQDLSVFDRLVFKAAMLTLVNLDLENKDEVIWDLLRKVDKIRYQSKKEVQLEYLIYGIRNNVSDLQNKTKKLSSFHSYLKIDDVNPLFEAYYHFAAYVESRFSNLGDSQPSQAKLSAESSILEFKKVVASPGDWDIFVINLIKLLEFGDHNAEIEDILQKYLECNPNNINAYIYLCLYLHNYSPDSESLIYYLKTLSKLSPSDDRVLMLLEKWSKSGTELMQCLKLIFMFLDYPSNGEKLQAWQTLMKFLSEVKMRGYDNEFKKTHSYWKSRYKCWHWLYFHPSQVPHLKECDLQLIASKINVLSYFDKDHAYIRKAVTKFPSLKFALEKTS